MLKPIFSYTFTAFFLSLFLILGFTNCKKNYKAADLPADIGQYVYGFTSGTISKGSDIRVQFVGGVIDPSQIGQEVANGVLKFKPSVVGTAVWEDVQTIVFKPEKPFESGQSYVATVFLNKIYDNQPKNIASFEFDFLVKNQMMEVNIDGLEASDINDLSVQQLLGEVLTADLTESSNVEKILSATQNGKSLPIQWQHDEAKFKHSFIVKNISRTNKTEKIVVSWNGNPIGVNKKSSIEQEVLPLGEFKVTNVRAIHGDKPYFLVHFSDPLSTTQAMEGLVGINNYDGRLNFDIEKNQLKIYPSGTLAGDYQVAIYPGVLNIQNAKMQAKSTWDVTFEQKKPAVRLVGNGVIIPRSKSLTFPFEAISLNAVEVEIFKIYNNNILQFFQTNDLEGSEELERVGRVVLQKKIDLTQLNPNADISKWTRYALDLSQMMDQDPSAIYQIRIGFRPEYAAYACADKNKKDNIVELKDILDENGEIISFYNDWYGITGYFDDYDWDNRDNPCKREYYNRDVFVHRNLLASNLGITVKKGKDGSVFVAIADLRTTEKVAGATVQFFDYKQQLLKSITTDSEGMIFEKFEKEPFAIIAKKDLETGYMKLGDGSALSLSKFDVAGQVVQKGLKGFIYGERGVWRPGDSLYLNFILEDETQKLPKNHPINVELRDSRGQIQKSFSVSENLNGIYPIYMATESAAPTGNWLTTVKVGGTSFSKTIPIETIKPNRLKINLDFKKEKLLAADNDLNGQLQVNWLHGAPAKALKAKIEMQLQPSYLKFDKFDEYQFSDPATWSTSASRVIFEDVLDENGAAKIKTNLLNNLNAPGKFQVNFKTRAFEAGGDFSTNSFSIPFFPYNNYVGLKMPRNNWGQERFEVDRDGNIELISLNQDGKIAPNRTLSAGVYEINWNWWYDHDGSNVARFNSTNHFNANLKKTISTNSEGKANWTLNLKKSGRYLVRVCDSESGYCTGRYFYVGYPYYEDDEDGNSKKEATMLAFKSDKTEYQIGETAHVKVPAGNKGKILMTVESGSNVLESYWKEVSQGENDLTFKITKEMLPNAYVHVSLLQPHAQTENDLPIRLYGVIPIKITDENTILKPTIKMPEVLQPEQEINIEVAEASGKDMAYTIAVVDDGLLDLTNFKTPDPHAVFFAKEALGVRTWDGYDQVLGAFGGELERILAVGGDDAVGAKPEKQKANRFKPVVKHLGPYYLPKGAKNSHKIKMPNYVGSVRTMVVASKAGAHGSAEKTTPVRKPLMLLATLPRVLSPGEKLRLPVNIFAMESKVKNVNVSISESSGLIKILGKSIQSLSFAKPGEDLAYFDIEVNDNIGIAKFDIQASGNGEKASQQIEIEVRNPNPYQSRVVSKLLEPNEVWNENFQLVGMKGTNTGVLEVSNIPAIDLEKRLKYLIRYPYGCVEQTTSAVFPQLFVGNLMEMNADKKQLITDNITSAIDKLKLFQNGEGGFNYWPNGGYVNHWGSTYAGHFLVEAKKMGYAIPPNMLENWIKFQKKSSQLWSPEGDHQGYYSYGDSQFGQAYRLYTLALANAADLGAMNRMRGLKNLENRPKWLLAAAYAAAGKKEIASQLIKDLNTNVSPYRDLSGNFGSHFRDKAIFLEVLTLMGEKDKALPVLEAVCENLRSSGWMSTQDIAYSLMAVGKYVGDHKPTGKIEFSYQFGNKAPENTGSNMAVIQRNIDIEKLETPKMEVKNTSKMPIYVRLALSGQPKSGAETNEANKLAIEVNYFNNLGKKIDPTRLTQGTDFYAEVIVKHPGLFANNMQELALEQVFPAGWEIINSRMDALQDTKQNSASKYRDFRDDRVNTFFDLKTNQSKTYYVKLNAAYLGKYYHPAVSCQAMYDNSIYARQAGKWVEIITQNEI